MPSSVFLPEKTTEKVLWPWSVSHDFLGASPNDFGFSKNYFENLSENRDIFFNQYLVFSKKLETSRKKWILPEKKWNLPDKRTPYLITINHQSPLCCVGKQIYDGRCVPLKTQVKTVARFSCAVTGGQHPQAGGQHPHRLAADFNLNPLDYSRLAPADWIWLYKPQWTSRDNLATKKNVRRHVLRLLSSVTVVLRGK